MEIEITVESVCQFILNHGGKVKNTILVSHFKKVLNNPATKDAARQKFKECVNTVAVVKTENGDKYVQLKKKYKNASPSATSSSSEISADGISSNTVEEYVEQVHHSKEIDAKSTHNKSFTTSEDLPYADSSKHESSLNQSSSEKYISEKPPYIPSNERSKKTGSDNSSIQVKKEIKSVHESIAKAEESIKHHNLTSAKKEKHSGELATDSQVEPVTMQPDSKDKNMSAQPVSSTDNDGFVVPSMVNLRKKKEKKENVPPSPVAEHLATRWTSVDRLKSSFLSSSGDQRAARARPVSIIQGTYAGSVERARQSFQSKQKLEDSASLALSERSLDSKGEELDDEDDRHIPSVALDINEKAWIIRSAQGNLVEMRKLLNIDATLADKKDFVMGYSALHWAAKKGNADMVNMLIDQKVDVDARSNGGYTPLHIAAMHGHEHIISLLIDAKADGTIRDYSGHQPIHYLKAVSLPLQRILFGNDPSHLHTPIKEFAAGLRSRPDSVRKAQYRLISGGFSSVGSFVASSKTHEEQTRSPDLDQDFARTGSLKSKMNKLKKGKKSKDEKPKISVVSVDDSDSGYSNRLNATMSSMSLSSSPLPRRSGNYNVTQQRRSSSKSSLDYD